MKQKEDSESDPEIFNGKGGGVQITAEEQRVEFKLVACISKEVELLGKNSGLEEATRNKKNTWSSPWPCGLWGMEEKRAIT